MKLKPRMLGLLLATTDVLHFYTPSAEGADGYDFVIDAVSIPVNSTPNPH